jgi:Tfp pilus assembly protein PilF
MRPPTVTYLMHWLFNLCHKSYPYYRIALFILGSINSVLVYYLAKKIFNPAIGRIASLMASFYVPFIFLEGDLTDPVFGITISIIWFLLLLNTFEKPSGKKWFLCGILWSLAATSREFFFPFGVIVFVYLIYDFFARKPRDKKALYYSAIFLAGFITILGYMTARNVIIGKDFVIAGWFEGGLFYGSNTPDRATAAHATSWLEDKRLVNMPYVEGHVKKRSEYSRFFFKKAFEYIAKHPIEWISLLIERFYLFWNGNEPMSDSYIYEYAPYSSLVRFFVSDKYIFYPFGIIGPLAIVGMMIATRNDWKTRLLAAIIISFAFASVFRFIFLRYRAPIVTFIIVFSSYTIWQWYKDIVAKRFNKEFFISIAIFAVLLILCNFYHPPVDPVGRAYLALKKGWGYLQMKDAPNAILSIEKCAELYPGTPDSKLYMQLANLYSRNKQPDKAFKAFQKAIQIEPGKAKNHLEFARFLESNGKVDDAIFEYDKAVNLRGLSTEEYVSLCFKLAGVYEKSGRPDLTIAMYEKLVKMNASNSYLIKKRIEALKKSAEKVIGGGTDKK